MYILFIYIYSIICYIYMAESEELKSLLMIVKERSEKVKKLT